MDRREFIQKSGAVVAGASGVLSLPVLTSCSPEAAQADSILAGKKWGMVIDLTRCRSDCTACMDACRQENNVAFHDDKRWDIHWIRRATLHPKEGTVGEEKDMRRARVARSFFHRTWPVWASSRPNPLIS